MLEAYAKAGENTKRANLLQEQLAEARKALAAVRETTDLSEAVDGADFVIEAVFEDLELKRSVFAELDQVAPPDAVLASNSSTMGISKIADATSRPERCISSWVTIRRATPIAITPRILCPMTW